MPTRVTVISSSLNPQSHSRLVARALAAALEARGAGVEFFDFQSFPLPDLLSPGLYEDANVVRLKRAVLESDGTVLASPVYNWQLAATLKRAVEILGEHGGGLRAVWLDKLITFACAGGLHHSYMAYSPMAMSMMMDFKCVINPYMVYAAGTDFADGRIASPALERRIEKTAAVKLELIERLKGRTYESGWEV